MVSVLAGFPALAVRAWPTGGSRKLALVTAAGLIIIAVAALTMGSETFGNRLSARYGYANVASRILILYMITLGLPLLTMAAVIRALQPATGAFTKPYVIAVGAGLVTWAIATIISVYVMPLLA
jgi:hypothetical protein